MLRRPFRRAAVLSLGALLAFAGTAAADSVQADGVAPIVNGSHFLGDVAPGATVSSDVRFRILCVGLQHVDANQSVVLSAGPGNAPLDGAIVSVSTATLAPLTTPWAPDGQGCPDPTPVQDGGAQSHVVLRAPTTAGVHVFAISWDRTLQPAGSNDANAIRTAPSVSFSMRVAANTPPSITVPASFSMEADTRGGWTSSWVVSATDVEDSPDPTPICSPAAGEILALGTTTVSCRVTDSAGASDSETFDVTVVDTTPPTLSPLPDDITVTTEDPTGRNVDFATPGATDLVDPTVGVSCTPASGAHFDVGPTPVTCTATDGSGNQRSGTFKVTVVYDPPLPPLPSDTASAVWLEPVGGSGSTFVANRGRTIPVKVLLFVEGHERTSGRAWLHISPCAATTPVDLPLTWSGGRWNVSLDTSAHPASCYTVDAWIDGLTAGSFTLELRGDAAAKTAAKRTGTPERTIVPTTRSKPTKSR